MTCVTTEHLYNTCPKNRVSEPQDGGQNTENAVDHVQRYAQHVERQPQSVKLVYVRHAVDGYTTRLVQIVVKLRWFQLVELHQVLVVLSKIHAQTVLVK